MGLFLQYGSQLRKGRLMRKLEFMSIVKDCLEDVSDIDIISRGEEMKKL